MEELKKNISGIELLGISHLNKITNGGDLCSYSLKIARKNNEEPALIITKTIATSDKELFDKDGSWKLIDENSEEKKYFFQQNFSIKLSTLKEINTWIESLEIKD